MDASPRLSGEEWQLWAERLLQRRYAPGEYQRVPDNQKGDAGIEGFAISTGDAFQIYGPEEPLSTDQRHRKLRDKVSVDLRKFINNQETLSGLFGRVKIRRWVLLVPFFDGKEIVSHAATKTEEVIAANLRYVDNDDFRVLIMDEDAFAVERNQLLNANLGIISLVPNEVAPRVILEWASENDTLVQTLDDKISRIPTVRDRRSFRDQIIKHFIEGQNILEELRKYPEAYKKIRTAKSERARYLATEVGLAIGSPATILQNALERIKKVVKEEVGEVCNHTVEAVAWEAVSDWLIRCPLDFPNEA